MSTKNDNRNLISSKEFYVLGTSNLLTAYGENSEYAIYEAMKKLLDIDNKMSVYKDTSDFSKINILAGEAPVFVGADTYYVIDRALQYARLSKGAFNPTIRPIVDLWNIGKENERIPSQEEIKEKLKFINYEDILLDEKNSTIMLAKRGEKIDGGAIAKGFAADAVRDIFIENEIKNALIDLGGNIFALGSNPSGDPWRVGIQDPLTERGQFLGILSVIDKSVVTSGDYERFFIKNNKKFHHILDPRTGYPSNNGVISATIVSDCSIDGDALSTCAYVMGVNEGLKLIESIDGVDVIFVTDDRKIYLSSGIKDNFKLANSAFNIEL
jgi:thiamine biosynthesis lipoprotein